MLNRWYVPITKPINQTLMYFLNPRTAEKTEWKINSICAVVTTFNEWNKTVRANKNQTLFESHIQYRADIYLSYDRLLLIEFISIQNFCRVSQSSKEFTSIRHFDFLMNATSIECLIRNSINQTLMYFLNSSISEKTK